LGQVGGVVMTRGSSTQGQAKNFQEQVYSAGKNDPGKDCRKKKATTLREKRKLSAVRLQSGPDAPHLGEVKVG